MERIKLTNSLAYRQALTAVFVAFVIGIILSTTQVLFDWFQEMDRYKKNIVRVMLTLEKPAAQALYTVDRSLAGIVVDGLIKYKSVYRAALVDDFGEVYAIQEVEAPAGLWRNLFMELSDSKFEFSIPLTYGPAKRNVGHLDAYVDTYGEMFDFFERASITFIGGMLRNFTLALCLIFAFNVTLVRPLKKLIEEISMLTPGGEKSEVGIPDKHGKTELGMLAENANRIFTLYEQNAQSLRVVEKKLRNQKAILETTVEERTASLSTSNEQLRLEIGEKEKLQVEREKIIEDLQSALDEIKKLSGMLPICANCKKIRDDKGYWNQLEEYISKHSEVVFSHGICPECVKKLYPELDL